MGIAFRKNANHFNNYSYYTGSTGLTPVDIVEGFAGIIYRAGDLDVDYLKKISAISRATFASDDMVLSFALGQAGVKKLRLETRNYNKESIYPMPYGLGEDALHRGAGILVSASNLDINLEKYQKTFNELLALEKESLNCEQLY